MSISRASLNRGPGVVALGANILAVNGGFNLDIETERFDVPIDTEGVVDRRRKDRRARLQFTPAGKLSSAYLSALHPYQTPVIGGSIFGVTDVAAYAHSKAGKKVTLHNGAISKCPDLHLGATKTLFGQAEILGITINDGDPEDAASLYTVATVSYTEPVTTTASIKTQVFAAAWGTRIASILADDGWTISVDTNIAMHAPDGLGTIDATLQDVSVMAKCRPYNLAESDILDAMDLQGAGGAIGASERSGHNLVIQSAALTVTIYDAALVQGPLKWGVNELRAGEIGFIGHRSETAGVFGGLYLLFAA